MRVERFELDCRPDKAYVRFPFVFKGEPVKGVSCALSLRSAGDMGFAADAERGYSNRRAFFADLGIPFDRVFSRSQVHSLDVAIVEGRGGSLPPGDGIALSDPASFACVTAADCLPIFLLDRDTLAFAVVHSGWKGTGIVLAALRAMERRWGTRPSSVAAVFGPCIRGCCYAVDEERAAAFESAFGPAVHRDGAGVRIDLQAANARLLETAGAADLAICGNCTFTDERLGSFRREGPDRFTRMAAVVGWLPEEQETC
ncbi:MAG: hypothetical protein A2Z99_05295, partial [Treponema sp. GWB1_62_6]